MWSREARGQALEIDGKCPKPASGSEMNVVDKPLAHIPRRTGVWASWRAAWLIHCCSPKMDHAGQKRNNGGSQPDRSKCIRGPEAEQCEGSHDTAFSMSWIHAMNS